MLFLNPDLQQNRKSGYCPVYPHASGIEYCGIPGLTGQNVYFSFFNFLLSLELG